jgi:H+/Cl- antiporter ClcA
MTAVAPRRYRTRKLLALSRRWRRRLIFLVGGLAVGAAAVLLAISADFAQTVFGQIMAQAPRAALAVTPAGFALVAFLTRRYFPNAQGSGLIIGAVIAAGLTSLAVIGNYTYFGTTGAVLEGAADWMAVPVCGVVGGLLGGLFSRIVIAVARGLPGAVGQWIGRHPVLFAASCGFGVALCGLASGDAIYATGYGHAKALLDGTGDAPWSFGLLKMAATTLSAISGIPGGIFSPSLAPGAGLGANVAALFPGTQAGAVVVLGMAAYFTGVVQALITAFVIVTEMTNNHAMLIPLMSASVIAYATSRLVCPVGIYHAPADTFTDRKPWKSRA